VGADWVLVNVLAAGFELGRVEDKVVGKASLPDWEVGGQTPGEAALDEVHNLRDGSPDWSEEKVGVVGHDDEGMEFVCVFGPVVLQGLDEKFGVSGELEEATAVVGDSGDEKCSGGGASLWDGHTRRV
jgi:hypothetical protein